MPNVLIGHIHFFLSSAYLFYIHSKLQR